MISRHTSAALDPLSARVRERVFGVAAFDTSNRLVRGPITYLFMLASIGISSKAYFEHPFLMWTITTAISVAVGMRFVAFHYYRPIYNRSPKLWWAISGISVLAIALACGVLYTSFVLFYGYEQWTFVLMMIWITSISSGALVTLMADIGLLRAYSLLIFVPPLIASLYVGGLRGNCWAFAIFLYTLFQVVQGGYIHNIYWQQLIGRELEVHRGEELEQARRASEDASRAKSQFLAHMSHEIRMPMHGVLGVADLLLHTDLSVQQKQLVDLLNSSAEGLLHVINEILDLSKVEAGKLTLELIPVNVRALGKEVLSILTPEAQDKQLTITAEIDDLLPDRLVCDPVRMRQVLINLLGNAIKFTDQGSVMLDISVVGPAQPGRARVRFSVTDTGIGIAEDKQALIFEPFSQGDSPVNRRYGGTGLGLSIGSQIVRMMGGELSVRSKPGQGSCFSFTCDLEQGAPPVSETAIAQASGVSRHLHILVAEDNPINQLIIKKALHAEGHTIVIAQNGREAVDAALAAKFDIILMDNQMPELSGVEAARIIKAKRPEVPIIGVSANAMEGDREHFLQAGMNDYVSKPFRRNELIAAIDACLQKQAA